MAMLKKNEILSADMKADAALFTNAVELGTGKTVGFAAWLNYLGLGIDDVGIVISTFNQFTTGLVAARRLMAAGYHTAWEAMDNNVAEDLHRCAMNIIGLWQAVFGVNRRFRGEAYETALDYPNGRINGFELCIVKLEMVTACFERAANIDGELPLADVEAFCFDSEAIKRFYGEYTIDATKKPEDFLRDKPFFSYMKNVSQRSRKDYSVAADWDSHSVKEEGTSLKAAKAKDGSDKRFLSVLRDKKGNVRQREDGRGFLYQFDMVDIYQEVRAEAAQYLRELATAAMNVPVQKLPAEELKEIAKAGKTVSKVTRGTVSDAAVLLKQEWQSMATSLKARRASVEKEFGKKSYEAEQQLKVEKQHRRVCYNAVTNMLRKAMKGIDAVTRIRVLLSVVIGDMNQIDWEHLSDFAHTALPEEWFVYVMHVMRNDRFTPQETMDKVSFVTELTDEELVSINGSSVTFHDGILEKDGEAIAFADGVDLNGEFTLRVCDDGVYACHDIVSLVNIPEADESVTLFCTKADAKTARNVDYILESVKDCQVTLAPFQHDAILVNHNGTIENVGKFRCDVGDKNSSVINALYGNKQGVSGTVVEAVEGFFDDKNKGRCRIVVFVMKNTVETPDEAAEILVPDKVVAIKKEEPVFNFNGPAVGFDDLF